MLNFIHATQDPTFARRDIELSNVAWPTVSFVLVDIYQSLTS